MRNFHETRFDDTAESSTGLDLPNLADLMLVFVTGLVAALAASSGALLERRALEDVELSRELPQLPAAADASGDGLEALGQVFRDPETGKL
ncbi:MAG: hypothetical protein AAGE43_15590, partial [Pseudomonadota bacterium]